MTGRFATLLPGDPAPWFHGRTTSNPDYGFHSVAGRYVVLCFFGTARDAIGAATIAAINAHSHLLDGQRACLFGVSADPQDRDESRVHDRIPGVRYFWDFDGTICKVYGAAPRDQFSRDAPLRRFWVVLDPTLRVLQIFPFTRDGSDRETVFAFLEALPPPDRHAGIALQAPILYLPNVFEPDFCRKLTALYEADGGAESGFMREIEGKTTLVHDPAHKVRRDYHIQDPQIIGAAQARIHRRISPEIEKAFQFKVTRMERYLVACYGAEDGGHFRAHRDNLTKGTAHRRFAVSINLNADFDGGDLIFPEYGQQSYRPPPGGAVVFACSLLHMVTKVTRGRRFAFLPFLYDDAAAKQRAENNQFLDETVNAYKFQ